jgi:hypothetical protein
MDAQVADVALRFSDRVARLMERVEHRVARTPAEKEAVYRLRYDAYIRNELIEPRADALLHDESYDDAPNSWITATFIDGELASTTRINLGADEDANLPALGAFPDLLAPHLRAGHVTVELTRVAARRELSGIYPELPYITMRPGYLAADHFNVDFAIASARAEHTAFYRRVFRFVEWCEPRDYPSFTAKVACLGLDYQAARDTIESRYPFFRSTLAERQALFGPSASAALAGARATSDRESLDKRVSA